MDKKKLFDQHVLKLIHSKGFKAMTVRDIAQSMNCDVANIYNYTQSKGALLEKYLFDISHNFHSEADKILTSQLDPVKKLKSIIRLHIQLSQNRPYHVALLINEYRNLPDDQLIKFNKLRKNYEKKIGKLIKSGIDEGFLKPLNVDILTASFLGSLRWMYDKFVEGNKKPNPFDIESDLIEFIVHGMLLDQ